MSRKSQLSKVTQAIAWCWANGLIEVGQKRPKGAIEIARGPETTLRHEMAVAARHGYSGQLLVPGIPEAEDQEKAGDALSAWIQWRAARNTRGLEWNPKALAEAGVPR